MNAWQGLKYYKEIFIFFNQCKGDAHTGIVNSVYKSKSQET